ncbi:amino acid/amide ABC transporter ATP-binding protein 1, HAAT family [Rhizobiales bacterium GAS113]|nr:amino acid/amide ABC transporter ATP-binding protein 1, HAAT family [Rhizobiales bacterium GAS113]
MTALRVQDVTVAFGGLRAVDTVALDVARGERRVMLGPNGAGKTTLFNAIGGQVRSTRGRILLDGRDVTRLKPFRRAHAGLARTFQITTLFQNLTVEDNILLAVQAFSPRRYAMLRSAARIREIVERVASLLRDWRFGAERSMLVRDLSYGEQRKLEIAMALAHQPRILLLDEPTAGLSTAETENVVSLIKGLSRDVTLLIIEHDMDVAFAIGDRFTVLSAGAVLAEGTAEDIRANPKIQAIYFGESG